MSKFKKNEQYIFGKLRDSNTVAFVKTPKKKIFSGDDLAKRGIHTYDEFYEKNPCNFRIHDNISICTQEDGELIRHMTKTILEPVKDDEPGLADGVTPLHQSRNNDNKDLVKVYSTQVENQNTQILNLQESNNTLAQKVVSLTESLARIEVEKERLEEKYEDQKADFDAYKKEFGDIIREARETTTPSLGDRIGELVSKPEAAGVLADLGSSLAAFLKSKASGGVPAQTLNDGPPPSHRESFSDNAEEVFSE